MAKLCEMLDESRIVLDLGARDFDTCAAALTRQLVERGVLDAEQGRALEAELRRRERSGATGIGRGVMIPHAYLDGLSQTLACFARLAEPMAYGPPEGEPVDLVLLITGPEAAQPQHLRILAHIARLMHDGRLVDELRRAATAEEALRAFREAEARHA